MSLENLGNRIGVNEEGDIVPLEEVTKELGYTPLPNAKIIEAASDASRRLLDDAEAIAPNIRVDHEGNHHIYPHTAQQIIATRLSAPKPVERYDAQAELGGGLAPYRNDEKLVPLENVLDEQYRPWQEDIRVAVEQFGVAEFSLADFRTMKPDDFKIFCEHFYTFVEGVDIHRHLIEGVQGRRELDDSQTLTHLYGERTPEELLEYAKSLKWLRGDLEDTGIPRFVRAELHAPEVVGQDPRKRGDIIRGASKRIQRHHGRIPQVVRNKQKLVIEWHEK